MNITVQAFKGSESTPFIPDLARLRIEVFREYPYLYEGDMKYENEYLQSLIQSPNSILVIAFDRNQIIGASTGKPLKDESPNIQRPWIDHGENINEVFYYGESVLSKKYRGLGIGRKFFHEREEYARQIPEIRKASFCAVVRPDNHPLKPDNYRPLDKLWTKMGFSKLGDHYCEIAWKDIDQEEETSKSLVFWKKDLQ